MTGALKARQGKIAFASQMEFLWIILLEGGLIQIQKLHKEMQNHGCSNQERKALRL
jgi:hypothetical protein